LRCLCASGNAGDYVNAEVRIRMADPTEHLREVQFCSPGTLRICAHVENILCLRDFICRRRNPFRIVLTMANIDTKEAF
jgi:hypothetical protein